MPSLLGEFRGSALASSPLSRRLEGCRGAKSFCWGLGISKFIPPFSRRSLGVVQKGDTPSGRVLGLSYRKVKEVR